MLHIHRNTGCLLIARPDGTLLSCDKEDGHDQWTIPPPAFAEGQPLFIAQIITKYDQALTNDAFVLYKTQAEGPSYIAHIDTTAGVLKSHLVVDANIKISSFDWCTEISMLAAATPTGIYLWGATSPPSPKGFILSGDFNYVYATAWQIVGARRRSVVVIDLRNGFFRQTEIPIKLNSFGKFGFKMETHDDFSVSEGGRFVNYSLKKPKFLAGILPL